MYSIEVIDIDSRLIIEAKFIAWSVLQSILHTVIRIDNSTGVLIHQLIYFGFMQLLSPRPTLAKKQGICQLVLLVECTTSARKLTKLEDAVGCRRAILWCDRDIDYRSTSCLK